MKLFRIPHKLFFNLKNGDWYNVTLDRTANNNELDLINMKIKCMGSMNMRPSEERSFGKVSINGRKYNRSHSYDQE